MDDEDRTKVKIKRQREQTVTTYNLDQFNDQLPASSVLHADAQAEV